MASAMNRIEGKDPSVKNCISLRFLIRCGVSDSGVKGSYSKEIRRERVKNARFITVYRQLIRDKGFSFFFFFIKVKDLSPFVS